MPIEGLKGRDPRLRLKWQVERSAVATALGKSGRGGNGSGYKRLEGNWGQAEAVRAEVIVTTKGRPSTPFVRRRVGRDLCQILQNLDHRPDEARSLMQAMHGIHRALLWRAPCHAVHVLVHLVQQPLNDVPVGA